MSLSYEQSVVIINIISLNMIKCIIEKRKLNSYSGDNNKDDLTLTHVCLTSLLSFYLFDTDDIMVKLWRGPL